MSPLLSWCLLYGQECLVLVVGLALVRVARGPAAQDRVLALDSLYTSAMLLMLLLGLTYKSSTYFEGALLIALFVFALAKTFWPRRAVTLPTIEPTPGRAEYDQRIEQLGERIKELEARLARMEVEPELQASESDKV